MKYKEFKPESLEEKVIVLFDILTGWSSLGTRPASPSKAMADNLIFLSRPLVIAGSSFAQEQALVIETNRDTENSKRTGAFQFIVEALLWLDIAPW